MPRHSYGLKLTSTCALPPQDLTPVSTILWCVSFPVPFDLFLRVNPAAAEAPPVFDSLWIGAIAVYADPVSAELVTSP